MNQHRCAKRMVCVEKRSTNWLGFPHLLVYRRVSIASSMGSKLLGSVHMAPILFNWQHRIYIYIVRKSSSLRITIDRASPSSVPTGSELLCLDCFGLFVMVQRSRKELWIKRYSSNRKTQCFPLVFVAIGGGTLVHFVKSYIFCFSTPYLNYLSR